MFADLVEKVENGYNHDFNSVKHKLKYTEGEIDMKIFSRLREPMKTALMYLVKEKKNFFLFWFSFQIVSN